MRVFLCVMFSFLSCAWAQTLVWPLQVTGGNQFKSSDYGIRQKPQGGGETEYHFGIDIACAVGTPILAVGNGTVAVCSYGDPVFGKYIILSLDQGIEVMYAHLSETWAARGSRVRQGQVIGKTGNTGLSTGPHLHFSSWVDPMRFYQNRDPYLGVRR